MTVSIDISHDCSRPGGAGVIRITLPIEITLTAKRALSWETILLCSSSNWTQLYIELAQASVFLKFLTHSSDITQPIFLGQTGLS